MAYMPKGEGVECIANLGCDVSGEEYPHCTPSLISTVDLQ